MNPFTSINRQNKWAVGSTYTSLSNPRSPSYHAQCLSIHSPFSLVVSLYKIPNTSGHKTNNPIQNISYNVSGGNPRYSYWSRNHSVLTGGQASRLRQNAFPKRRRFSLSFAYFGHIKFPHRLYCFNSFFFKISTSGFRG